MQLTTKTDPITGLDFKALELNDGTIVLDTALSGTVQFPYDSSTQSYQVPKCLFDHKRTLTMQECSNLLGVSKMYVSRLCNNGILTAAKINGAMVIDYDSAIRYRKERQND